MFKQLLQSALGGLIKPAPDNPATFAEVEEIAAQMTPEQRAQWAIESTRMVQDKLPPAEVDALKAAELALAEPTPDNVAAADAAAAAAGFQGPAAWSAQAASASAVESTSSVQAASPSPMIGGSNAAEGAGAAVTPPPEVAPGPPLTHAATAGAVKLAAAVESGSLVLPEDPGEASQTALDEAMKAARSAGQEQFESALSEAETPGASPFPLGSISAPATLDTGEVPDATAAVPNLKPFVDVGKLILTGAMPFVK